jgi:hypothetical protein
LKYDGTTRLHIDTGMDATRRRIPDEPTAAERADIARRITLLPLMRRDRPGVLDWPGIAERLAEELAALSARLAGDPQASAADHERLDRAAVVLRDYRAVRAADDEQQTPYGRRS